MDTPPPVEPPSPRRRAADDALDAATGLDLRAWATVRDLCRRPWTVIQHSVFDHGTRYVGAIKLAFVLASLSAVIAVLLPETLSPPPKGFYAQYDAAIEEGLIEGSRDGGSPLSPEELAQRKAQLWPVAKLTAQGVSEEFFMERMMQKLQIIIVFLSLAPAVLFAFVHRRFEPRVRWFQHLNLIYYLTSLELIIATFLVPLTLWMRPEPAAGASPQPPDIAASSIYLLTIVIGYALMQLGVRMPTIVRFYPASAGRQAIRGIIIFTLLLFVSALVMFASLIGSLMWTLWSFGV